MKKIRIFDKKVIKTRVTEIRVSKIRVSEIRVTEIRISSNHRELHGAIFVLTQCHHPTTCPEGCGTEQLLGWAVAPVVPFLWSGLKFRSGLFKSKDVRM